MIESVFAWLFDVKLLIGLLLPAVGAIIFDRFCGKKSRDRLKELHSERVELNRKKLETIGEIDAKKNRILKNREEETQEKLEAVEEKNEELAAATSKKELSSELNRLFR